LTNSLRAAIRAFALACMVVLPAHAQDKARPDVVLKGDGQCTRCHDANDDKPVLSIGATKHGTNADGRTPTCTSCHGASETHMNKPADAKERPRPDRMFTKTSPTPVAARNEACLACHQGGKRIHWTSGAHANRDVACSSCHQVHTQHDKVRDKVTQSDVCFTCHKEQRSQIHRPSRHPILEGKVACSDCHNPHGSAGEKMLVRDNVNDTCYQCHMEKRGPFVRSHQPVQENCAICHNPHGSTVDNLLRTRAPLLCQQCHEPTSHRGGLPGFNPGNDNGSRSVGITLARACLNCHTNIHGTNNPSNLSNERTLRR
jgi:DmsE family decaheme c-type cytochrome